jgi:predicted dinucleotide-binding enzyme
VKVVFIGAGALAQAAAARLVAAGIEEVVLTNRRGPAVLEEAIRRLGGGVRYGTAADVADADLVVLAVPWSRVPAALEPVGDWSGKVLVDATNRLEKQVGPPDGGVPLTSSEEVAKLAPGARVVKAFNHLAPHVLSAEPRVAGGRRVLFFSGDDAEAKEVFAAFVARLGFQGIDLGGLAAGGALHQFPGGPLPVRDLIQL